MKRYLKFIVLIISLGIFLLPKDNLLAKDLVTTCCNEENSNNTHEGMSCCSKKDQKSSSSTSTDKNQCKDDCCVTCVGCSIHANILFTKYFNVQDYLTPSPLHKQNTFSYITPLLSDGLKEIWQPPKL